MHRPEGELGDADERLTTSLWTIEIGDSYFEGNAFVTLESDFLDINDDMWNRQVEDFIR